MSYYSRGLNNMVVLLILAIVTADVQAKNNSSKISIGWQNASKSAPQHLAPPLPYPIGRTVSAPTHHPFPVYPYGMVTTHPPTGWIIPKGPQGPPWPPRSTTAPKVATRTAKQINNGTHGSVTNRRPNSATKKKNPEENKEPRNRSRGSQVATPNMVKKINDTYGFVTTRKPKSDTKKNKHEEPKVPRNRSRGSKVATPEDSSPMSILMTVIVVTIVVTLIMLHYAQ